LFLVSLGLGASVPRLCFESGYAQGERVSHCCDAQATDKGRYRCAFENGNSHMEWDPTSALCRNQPTPYKGTLEVRCRLGDTHYTWTLCVPGTAPTSYMYDHVVGSEELPGSMYIRANMTN